MQLPLCSMLRQPAGLSLGLVILSPPLVVVHVPGCTGRLVSGPVYVLEAHVQVCHPSLVHVRDEWTPMVDGKCAASALLHNMCSLAAILRALEPNKPAYAGQQDDWHMQSSCKMTALRPDEGL